MEPNKTFFLKQGAQSQRIEKNEVIDSDEETSFIFNKHFSSVVFNLNIPQYEDPFENFENIEEPLDLPREKYENNLSI